MSTIRKWVQQANVYNKQSITITNFLFHSKVIIVCNHNSIDHSLLKRINIKIYLETLFKPNYNYLVLFLWRLSKCWVQDKILFHLNFGFFKNPFGGPVYRLYTVWENQYWYTKNIMKCDIHFLFLHRWTVLQ